VRVLVNVTYSYAIVATAARSVQGLELWRTDESVQKLQFSHKWIKGILNRGGMSRRKITKEDKAVPDDEEIRRILKIGQDLYISHGHRPETCFNFDETALTYAIGPSHMFCPVDQKRATNIGINNDKLRITAVIAVNGVGWFAPLMLIIKHSASSEMKPDQTKMKVITDLFKKEGFTHRDGWIINKWEKTITIKGVTADHKCIYIRHTVSGIVITSQCKAWNDTVRMVMWYELVMKQVKDNLGKMLLWQDNCGSHHTASVSDVIRETEIDVAFLPPNMTSELQVLDLVVNGPIKSHIKNKRAIRLYDSFQKYKIDGNADMILPATERKNPVYSPPKPSMIEGILDLILLFEEQFTETKFRNCINKCFIATGTLPILQEDDSLPVKFMEYRKLQSFGTLSVIPYGTIDYDSSVVEDNLDTQQENIERGLFLYFVENNELIEEVENEEDFDENNF
jgi:DDE superfamily endonuclease